MISSIITPFRWYDKYYHQDRFNIECTSVCEFKLITDQKHLLPFQFKRTSSPFLINKWILRPCCNDPQEQILSELEQKLRENWSSEGAWDYDECGGMKAITDTIWGNTKICYEPGLESDTTYTINFNIAKFDNGSQPPLFVLNLYVNNVLQTSYQDSGYQTLTFTTPNVAGPISICFEFASYVATSAVTLDFVQITKEFEDLVDDVTLDTTLLEIKQYSTGYDVISYCGDVFSSKVDTGCYYSIIRDEGNNFYFSEVITVLDFIPEKSPYLMLEWYNTCDLTDVIYSGSNGCAYKNKLYFPDAVLTKPERPFKEEGEEDGNQTFNATFQKWEKNVSLIGYKLPEFIVDALTAVKLHDTIKYYSPVRKKQLTNDAAVEIESLDYEVEYVADDCFANVTLKMLLDSQFVDETCCRNIAVTVKIPDDEIIALNTKDPDITIWALSAPGSPTPTQYYIEKYNSTTGVWDIVGEFVSGVWVSDTDSETGEEIVPVGFILTDQSAGTLEDAGAWQVKDDGIYFCPTIESATRTAALTWEVTGRILEGVYGQIQWAASGSPVYTDVDGKFTAAEIAAGYTLTIDTGQALPYTYDIRIKSFDLNGNLYGYSDPFEITEP